VVIAGLVTGDRIERRGGVGDRPREHAVGRRAEGDQAEVGSDRDAAAARPEPDQPATGRGNPERAAEVAAVGERQPGDGVVQLEAHAVGHAGVGGRAAG
jgi:hypothetical protein